MRGMKKIAMEGEKQLNTQTHKQTLRLIDLIGPASRSGGKKKELPLTLPIAKNYQKRSLKLVW